MIGERCGQCEFYAYNSEDYDCCIPQWVPEKNIKDFNERIPEDCPIRNKTREEVNKEMELDDFKDKYDLTLFILMNLFGAPFTVIVLSVIWGWWGFGLSIILFIGVYKWWKYYGKHEGKLLFSPSFKFGNKTYKLKK